MQVAFSTRRLFHSKDALCGDSEINMVKAADGAMEAGIEDGLIKEVLRIISTSGCLLPDWTSKLMKRLESILVAFEDSFLIPLVSRCLHSH